MGYQERLVRFIENHDEPRAAATFSPEKERAAAVATITLPGAILLHEGQFDGRKVRLPVFLGRRPDEPIDTSLREFYLTLLDVIAKEGLRKGEWRLCGREGWPDNRSCLNIVAWCWEDGERRHLVAVNLSEQGSQGRIMLPWSDLGDSPWFFVELLDGTVFQREGSDLRDNGLYVELGPWRFHLCALRRGTPDATADENEFPPFEKGGRGGIFSPQTKGKSP
jgi:hypothetical protein